LAQGKRISSSIRLGVQGPTANDTLEELVSACLYGHGRTTEQLIEKISVADINKIASNGYSPITAAVEGSNLEYIFRLYEKGASLTSEDGFGKSAISRAADLSPSYRRIKDYIEALSKWQKNV
jgi:ankyrin repeat protein